MVNMPIVSAESRSHDPEVIRSADVATCMASLAEFLKPYQAQLQRAEQERHLQVYVEGLVSGIERKSIEPIATAHGLYRRPLQHFVGAGKWADTAVRDEMRRHIAEELGDPAGVLIIDGSGVPKQGTESVGVARQYCGRLGKVDNCQMGIYVGYSTPRGFSLLEADIYLPREWIDDSERRDKAYIPSEMQFRTNWQIADDQLQRLCAQVPHAWITGDDEFGRPTEFRDRLAERGERYLLEVPSNTAVRRPDNWPGRSQKWTSVRHRRDRHPAKKWRRIRLRDGDKGPIEVLAFCTRVETRRNGAPPRQEILLVMQAIRGGQTWYFLAPADAPLDVAELVRVAAHRHHIEQAFELAKGECGLAHYEVRSFVGWHHHMTLSMLALWFLTLERRRLGKKLLH
jgi:SRSO17 transposase